MTRRNADGTLAAFVDTGEVDGFSSEQPGLFACYQAAALGISVSGERAGQPLLRVVAGGVSSEQTQKCRKTEEQPVAEALGVSVYAKQLVHGHARAKLEKRGVNDLPPPVIQCELRCRVLFMRKNSISPAKKCCWTPES